MKVLVIGASGGSGRAAVHSLAAAGHDVTAFCRNPDALDDVPATVRRRQGDATRAADVDAAVAGQDAVVVTLGIREDALRVRLFGSRGTPMDVRSTGTRHVIAAMQRHGVRRLVVQTTYGIGESRGRLPFVWRLIFALLLKPQIADSVRQEQDVRASGLDWVLVQPVGLTDTDAAVDLFASPTAAVRSFRVPRRAVGGFLASVVTGPQYLRRTVALST